MRQPEDRAWLEAARLVQDGSDRDITWALSAWRPHLPPGHPALKILEEHRAYLRGERSALTNDELAAVSLRVMEITLLAG